MKQIMNDALPSFLRFSSDRSFDFLRCVLPPPSLLKNVELLPNHKVECPGIDFGCSKTKGHGRLQTCSHPVDII